MEKKMKYFILTMGCYMNKSDSERIEGVLLDMGLRSAGKPEAADIIILNTCSVRQTAEDRVYGLVRNFERLKRQKPYLLVAVTGCVAGRDKDGKIRAKMPGVDFFFPISELSCLPEMIFSRWAQSAKRETLSLSKGYRRRKIIGLPTSIGSRKPNRRLDYLGVKPRPQEWWRGWVVVQTGCSNYCSYCVVPYARGAEKNRPVREILAEVKMLVKNGAREINLLGQAVNGYVAPEPRNFSKDNPFYQKQRFTKSLTTVNDFAELLWEVSQIEGINRIGFFSAHPMYMTDKVIRALKLPKMMNYLHLPSQSGNNEVLRRMNRKYTREDYLKVINKIKKARPSMALATDIIVGFPGETKKQFADTVSLYKKCDFDLSYNAMYSPRTGTSAFRAFPDDVSREEKRRRWLVLQRLMEKNALLKNKKFVGRTVQVLVDGYRSASQGSSGVNWGFSREYKKVSFAGNKKLVGQTVMVKIKKAKEWELEGKSGELGIMNDGLSK